MPAKEVPADTEKAAKVYDVSTGKELTGWKGKLLKNGNDAVKTNSLVNGKLFILNDPDLKGVFAYDEFAGQVIKTKSVPRLHMLAGFLSDSDAALVREHLEQAHHLLFGKDVLLDSLLVAAKSHSINPVKERIETQTWDGKPRAESYFIDYLGAEDNDYTRTVTRKWLEGAVARVYHPGCKFDMVPVLQGKQGVGKSTAAKNLFPDKFSDSLKSMSTDEDYKKLQGRWILELGELSALNKTEIESVKNFITAQADTYRDSYGRMVYPHQRQCVFIGTTNHKDFLKDETGDRRFYPIKCGVTKPTKNVWQPDTDDILQILAEAKNWVDCGEELTLPDDVKAMAEEYQQEAAVENPMKDAIDDYLAMEVPADWAKLSIDARQAYFQAKENNSDPGRWTENAADMSHLVPLPSTTSREIMAIVFGKTTDSYLSGQANSSAKKIRLIMDNMPGWVAKRTRVNGRQLRRYIRTDESKEQDK